MTFESLTCKFIFSQCAFAPGIFAALHEPTQEQLLFMQGSNGNPECLLNHFILRMKQCGGGISMTGMAAKPGR